MEENKTPSPTIKEGEQQEETVELDNLSPVWFINGIPHIESPVKVKTGDELTVVTRTLNPECGVKYGDTGTLDLWYDRVNFGDKGESVYWGWAFKKLVPITLPANWQKNQQPKESLHTEPKADKVKDNVNGRFLLMQVEREVNKKAGAATPSMETKERGEQEMNLDPYEWYDEKYKPFRIVDKSYIPPAYVVDMMDGYADFKTTTLQAEIEELNNEIIEYQNNDMHLRELLGQHEKEVKELKVEREKLKEQLEVAKRNAWQ